MHPPASLECREACIATLKAARLSVVILDDESRILDEYRRHLSHSGQPGLGDAFFKWLWDNQGNPARCRRVPITSIRGSDRNFAEFPADPDLDGFDPSDRKFVAVAIASGVNPTIHNASDRDWADFRAPLTRYVVINFICP